MTFLIRTALVALLACGAAHAHDTPAPAQPQSQPAIRVAVSGAVQQPLSLGADDLRRFPADQIVTLTLPGRQAGAPPSVLKGVRLRAVLEQARLVIADHNTVKKLAIIAAASDGYTVVFSWSELFNAELGDSVTRCWSCSSVTASHCRQRKGRWR